jgi:hypothetical protein
MGEFKVELRAEFGSGEPSVARVLLQWQRLVNGVPDFGETRNDFHLAQAEVFTTLGMAFQVLRSLREKVAADAPTLELEESYAALYGFLWQAYKDRFQTAVRALGVDLGFFWDKDAKFEKGAAALVADKPELTTLVDLMRHYRTTFHSALAYYRNTYLEHRDAKVDPRMLASFHELDAAEETFTDVWRAIETIVAALVSAHLPNGFALAEIPEAERDPARPERFRIVVAPGGLRGRSAAGISR